MGLAKEEMGGAVEKAMESLHSKSRSITGQLYRDRIFNTLTKVTLKQYEGMTQANNDLSVAIDNLESCHVSHLIVVHIPNPFTTELKVTFTMLGLTAHTTLLATKPTNLKYHKPLLAGERAGDRNRSRPKTPLQAL